MAALLRCTCHVCMHGRSRWQTGCFPRREGGNRGLLSGMLWQARQGPAHSLVQAVELVTPSHSSLTPPHTRALPTPPGLQGPFSPGQTIVLPDANAAYRLRGAFLGPTPLAAWQARTFTMLVQPLDGGAATQLKLEDPRDMFIRGRRVAQVMFERSEAGLPVLRLLAYSPLKVVAAAAGVPARCVSPPGPDDGPVHQLLPTLPRLQVGDLVLVSWGGAPEWQVDAAVDGFLVAGAARDAEPAHQQEQPAQQQQQQAPAHQQQALPPPPPPPQLNPYPLLLTLPSQLRHLHTSAAGHAGAIRQLQERLDLAESGLRQQGIRLSALEACMLPRAATASARDAAPRTPLMERPPDPSGQQQPPPTARYRSPQLPPPVWSPQQLRQQPPPPQQQQPQPPPPQQQPPEQPEQQQHDAGPSTSRAAPLASCQPGRPPPPGPSDAPETSGKRLRME